MRIFRKNAFSKGIWTLIFAFSASCASAFIKQHLCFRALTLGIMASGTTQIAALKEYGRAYSRPVNEGGSLNIKNCCCHFIDVLSIIFFEPIPASVQSNLNLLIFVSGCHAA